ncbi:MAG: hypothetical protein PHD19_11710 [Dechloromonas sp.]|nr:hypothetical protein [Dechloromonas sp.]
MMEFKAGKHYEHASEVSQIEVRHVHWFDKGEITSLVSMRLRSRGKGPVQRSSVATFDAWDITPDELRSLAKAMNDAADSLIAHQAFIANQPSEVAA